MPKFITRLFHSCVVVRSSINSLINYSPLRTITRNKNNTNMSMNNIKVRLKTMDEQCKNKANKKTDISGQTLSE